MPKSSLQKKWFVAVGMGALVTIPIAGRRLSIRWSVGLSVCGRRWRSIQFIRRSANLPERSTCATPAHLVGRTSRTCL